MWRTLFYKNDSRRKKFIFYDIFSPVYEVFVPNLAGGGRMHKVPDC